MPTRLILLTLIMISGSYVEEGLTEETDFLSHARQLTFEGRRAGEGYFSADGKQMIFQSERMSSNPFYQIYYLDLETGDTIRLSPGVGKTTCAWFHPTEDKVLFASTHADPTSKAQQDAELEFRASGQTRRYSWDYDPEYELYVFDAPSHAYNPIAPARGYDAEGSFSPDGRTILFASNRAAYDEDAPLDEAKQALLERDPSYFIDLYKCDADGSHLVRLTDTPGYDGGPFFSPDGQRICWRRFSENGATAEIMTAQLDGSDVQQLTNIGAMSWAPYFHPSGEYLIFTTNKHGFANFELYLTRADGDGEPVRVTTTDGFDGLPVFHPDGDQLSWTSNRTADKTSQIFLADWDHAAARRMLGLDTVKKKSASALTTGRPEYSPAELAQHVEFLASDQLEGRASGSEGNRLATQYVADHFAALDLQPAGPLTPDGESFFDPFEFTAGVSLGENNEFGLSILHGSRYGRTGVESDQYRPLSYSATGTFDQAEVVFAGYGIRAPADEAKQLDEYDSYVHLDVKDKWVLVFRFLPDDVSPARRQQLSRHASLRRKAMIARDLGARGLLVVSGPESKVKNELVPLRFDGSLSGTSVAVLSITDELAARIMQTSVEDLGRRQQQLDTGEPVMGTLFKDVRVSASVDIEQQTAQDRNVLARLQAGDEPSDEFIIVGAHVDHLGVGAGGNSLARDDERDGIHYGADDNASGVAAMLEIAEALAAAKANGLVMKRDIVFAAWSAEELGLLGASRFLEDAVENRILLGPDAEAGESSGPRLVACLNLDMVGRLQDSLVLQGVGSSDWWRSQIERRNVPVGLPLTLSNDSYIPTDASAFYARGVPILSAFTGSHEDYHTPRDTADKLDYESTAKIAKLMGLLARSLVTTSNPPAYKKQTKPKNSERRANLRAYLGTVPDYAQTDVVGVQLSGVAQNGPAEQAGVRGGDVITELAGKKIENIYDYTFAIEALKIGDEVTIQVQRDGQLIDLKITPGSRD